MPRQRPLFMLAVLFLGLQLSLFSQTYRLTALQKGDTLGIIVFKLLPEIAPKHAAFVAARITDGFYSGSAFHRVIPKFMIQGGDPNSVSGPKETWGYGGYSETVPAEFGTTKHLRGRISAARTNDPNSFSGQFFICVVNAPSLDGQYSVFGEVISGMDVADKIVNMPRDANDNPINKVSMFIDVATSVSEQLEHQHATVFPQPARSSLSVVVDHSSTISIMNLGGDVVQLQHVDAGTGILDVSKLPCGVYVLQVASAIGTSYQPIVIAAP
ncbi:hypothetical protein BH10BAC6_BH10BAC6_13060 [soil metagenome]